MEDHKKILAAKAQVGDIIMSANVIGVVHDKSGGEVRMVVLSSGDKVRAEFMTISYETYVYYLGVDIYLGDECIARTFPDLEKVENRPNPHGYGPSHHFVSGNMPPVSGWFNNTPIIPKPSGVEVEEIKKATKIVKWFEKGVLGATKAYSNGRSVTLEPDLDSINPCGEKEIDEFKKIN